LYEYSSMRERQDFGNDIYAMRDQHAHFISALFPRPS
jgi:HJR/Mrr/RecB family endonuclease